MPGRPVLKAEESGPRRGGPDRTQKEALTFIVLGATAEPLSGSAEYLLALCRAGEGRAAQNRADSGEAGGRAPVHSRAVEAWASGRQWAEQYGAATPSGRGGGRSGPRTMLRAGADDLEDVERPWAGGTSCSATCAAPPPAGSSTPTGCGRAARAQQAADYLVRLAADVDGLARAPWS